MLRINNLNLTNPLNRLVICPSTQHIANPSPILSQTLTHILLHSLTALPYHYTKKYRSKLQKLLILLFSRSITQLWMWILSSWNLKYGIEKLRESKTSNNKFTKSKSRIFSTNLNVKKRNLILRSNNCCQKLKLFTKIGLSQIIRAHCLAKMFMEMEANENSIASKAVVDIMNKK